MQIRRDEKESRRRRRKLLGKEEKRCGKCGMRKGQKCEEKRTGKEQIRK